MNPTHQAMIDLLREQGYAIAVLTPEQIGVLDRQQLENTMQEHAFRILDDTCRVALADCILTNTELVRGEPMVAVVWSGRDCDGVQYSGEVRLVPANPKDVEEHIDHTHKWADGPCDYAIMKPSEAEKIEYTSRDLTMEAFENGRTYDITPED
jgi:hypothetical protein